MKTLGSRTAHLVTELYEQQRTIFNVGDIKAITGLSAASARSLVFNAERRGLVTRLKPGLYNLVPFELGRATEHIGNPYLIAIEAVGHLPYFLSHGTAFELHRIVTQPNLPVYVSCSKRLKPKCIGGYDYHFVLTTPEQMFGLTKHWVTKTNWVMMSDLERTIIDGLRQPRLVGGISDVAKGLWMKHTELNWQRLTEYALRLNVGAVIRRLGYLLEYYELANEEVITQLRMRLTESYQRLDPMLPAEGPFLARWRLQLNVSAAELDAIRFS